MRPRVLQLLTCLEPGGAEQMVLALARGLAPRCDVTVAALRGRGALAEAFEAAGARVVTLGIERGRDVPRLLALARLVRDERFDVVHTHLLHAGIAGRAIARLLGVPAVIHTQHNTVHWEARSALLRAANLATLGLAHRVIAVGERVADMTARHGGVPKARIAIIRNGVDTDRFRPAPARAFLSDAFGIPADAPVIGVVGGLRPEKGHGVLIGAMAMLARAIPRARLLVVGDGVLREGVERAVRANGLAEHVILAGARSDVDAIIPGCDVIALASFEEGVPVCALEAMACAVPVVATRVGGTPEVIEDGRTGLLVPPGDPKALAAALLEVLRRPELGRALGKAGRERVLERFGVARMVDETLALYEEALGNRHARIAPGSDEAGEADDVRD